MTAPDVDTLDWEKGGGLLPAIAQHARSGRVLMLGYLSRAALAKTIETGSAVFHSRTRDRLWMKGETSGNTLTVQSIETDCDRDTILMLVEPAGPTCHLGKTACFDGGQPFLDRLDALIADRCRERPAGSYTTRLLEAGVSAGAQKVGEEAVELALAAVGESDERVTSEAADLLFHLMVVLRQRGLALDDVLRVLQQRHAGTGN